MLPLPLFRVNSSLKNRYLHWNKHKFISINLEKYLEFHIFHKSYNITNNFWLGSIHVCNNLDFGLLLPNNNYYLLLTVGLPDDRNWRRNDNRLGCWHRLDYHSLVIIQWRHKLHALLWNVAFAEINDKYLHFNFTVSSKTRNANFPKLSTVTIRCIGTCSFSSISSWVSGFSKPMLVCSEISSVLISRNSMYCYTGWAKKGTKVTRHNLWLDFRWNLDIS